MYICSNSPDREIRVLRDCLVASIRKFFSTLAIYGSSPLCDESDIILRGLNVIPESYFLVNLEPYTFIYDGVEEQLPNFCPKVECR
jgi:hypothetical protein